MLDLVFQNLTADKAIKQEFFEKILNTVFNIMRSDLIIFGWIGISVNLVGEGKIKELNKKYRKKNKITDVLSFPLREKLEIGNWKLENEDAGDIFICLPFAKKQAKRENISIERKLAQLTVHGFLHLVGYDHELSERGANEMFNLEKQILGRLDA